MSKAEFISGNESVEDLISMVDRNSETSNSIISMISLTTAKLYPATYNQFIKSLKNKRTLIFDKYSKTFSFEEELNKDKSSFSLLSIFKNNRKKVISKLNDNKLNTMVGLLNNIQLLTGFGLDMDTHLKNECKQLKEKFNLQRKGAIESLNRFKWAKDICMQHKFEIGAKSMQFYVDVYDNYLEVYCD
jgi:hypothetical protein